MSDLVFRNDDVSSIDLGQFIEARGWQSQFKLLSQWAKLISPKPTIRRDELLVKGCESNVWLDHAIDSSGRHQFRLDSDVRTIKGLAVLLLYFMGGKTQQELATINLLDEFQRLGVERHLSPSRSNGLHALHQRMRELSQS